MDWNAYYHSYPIPPYAYDSRSYPPAVGPQSGNVSTGASLRVNEAGKGAGTVRAVTSSASYSGVWNSPRPENTQSSKKLSTDTDDDHDVYEVCPYRLCKLRSG